MYRPNKDNRPLFAPLGPLECRSQYLGTYSLIRRTKVFVFPSYAYITKSSQICPRLKTGSRFSKTRRWDPPSPSQKVDYLCSERRISITPFTTNTLTALIKSETNAHLFQIDMGRRQNQQLHEHKERTHYAQKIGIATPHTPHPHSLLHIH